MAIPADAKPQPPLTPDAHEQRVDAAEQRIEAHLKQHPHNFAPVFKELQGLKALDSTHFHEDLAAINKKLEDHKVLPHMHFIEEGERDFAVVAEDPTHKTPDGHNRETIVSESVGPPTESPEERQTYAGMRAHGFDRGRNSGWEASAPANGGAYGHFRRSGIGFQIPHGEHKELIDEALKLCGLECTAENEAAVEAIIEHESSWDPNATNDWDINARQGQPTQGLMQTRPDVFEKYALPGYNTNIKDPLSNIVAGIRYTEDKHGGLLRTPGVVSLAMNGTYRPY
jgi:Transglycosylase SLT domain